MSMVYDNSIPFGNIKIDKEGVWYYKGAEMFRKEIVNLFYENIKKDDAGRYIIELANDRCWIEVEDTPFVVNAVRKYGSKDQNDEVIEIILSDSTTERFDPSNIWIGKDNVFYCQVKDNKFHARFLRSSYYQIAEFIEYDEEKDTFFIQLNNQNYYIKSTNFQEV